MEILRLAFNKVFTFFMVITMLLLISCDQIIEEPIPIIEINKGFSIQLTAPSGVTWESNNPTVATVSSTGLVTALKVGNATISTYSSNGVRNIVCYLEISPKRTILMYIGADTNGLDNGSAGDEPKKQINEIRKGWQPGKGELLIYTDQTNRKPCLLRINETLNADGIYGIDTVHVYNEEHNSADADILSEVIHRVVSEYPADSYGMIFFSHASGWLPEGMLLYPKSLVVDKGDGTRHEMEYDAFAAAIPDHLFDFIIFEGCFMADVICMYELRNKTKYALASSAEIVSPGFTYIYKDEIMGLFDTKKPVESIVTGFGQAYTDLIKSIPENDVNCSTTLGVIKLSEMDNLAAIVKVILDGKSMDESTLTVDSIQRFDRPASNNLNLILSGERKSRYFDLGHVIENLVTPAQYTMFATLMDKTVVWKANTNRFLLGNLSNGSPNYSQYDGFFIKRHSGLSTYIERDAYPILNDAYKESSWYKAITP